LELKISAVLEDPELLSLKEALGELGTGTPSVNLFQTDLEALQTLYLKGRPDLLILDLDMRSVIGLETARAIRSQGELATLPMILISAKDIEADVKAMGFMACLVKPILTGAWKEAIQRARSNELGGAPPAQKPKHDSRRAARKAFQAPCIVSTTTKKLKGVLKDLSLTGARVHVETSLPLASMISLTFAVPNVVPLKIMQFKARVVRQTQDGYGITFWEMDPLTRGALASLTQK
jgi:CheY-like chemotaxis protein